MSVPQLVKLNNFFVQYLQGGCLVSTSMSSDQRDGSKINVFFQLNNQISLHCLLFWNIRWIQKVFQDTRRWSVIKLVTLNHGHLHLIILEIVVGYWKLKNFWETQVTRETRCHVSIPELLIPNLKSQVSGIIQKT